MITAIVQARIGSTRLPGKTLFSFGDTTLLGYQLDRLKHSKRIEKIIVATTNEPRDDVVADEATNHGCLYYRGSTENVLDRFYSASKLHKASLVVRVTADDPFKCPFLIDQGISLIEKDNSDYVSNTIDISYPEGLDFEVFTTATLAFAYENAKSKRHLEHVTAFIYENASQFKIGQIKDTHDLSTWRMTVDYLEDYKIMKFIANNVSKNVSYKNLINFIVEADLKEVMQPRVERNEAYNAELFKKNW